MLFLLALIFYHLVSNLGWRPNYNPIDWPTNNILDVSVQTLAYYNFIPYSLTFLCQSFVQEFYSFLSLDNITLLCVLSACAHSGLVIQLNFCISYDLIIPWRIFWGEKKSFTISLQNQSTVSQPNPWVVFQISKMCTNVVLL